MLRAGRERRESRGGDGREGLLDDKVILVNGGSQGVGAAVARAAVREGAVVAVTGRRPEPGDALVAELTAAGGTAMFGTGRPGGRGAGEDLRGPGGGGVRPCRLPGELGRADLAGDAAGHDSPSCSTSTSRSTSRRRSLRCRRWSRTCWAGERPGTVVNIITSSAHGGQPFLAPVRRREGGAAWVSPGTPRTHAAGTRVRINGLNIGWTATEGEDATQRAFHGAGDELARRRPPPGCRWAGSRQPDEIADFVVLLLSDRSGWSPAR